MLLGFRAAPHLARVAAVHASGDRAERLLRRLQLARRDREQPVHGHRQPLFELQLPFEPVASQPERGARARRDLRLEVLQVGANRLRGLGLRVGEIAEQVQVVHAREGARQLVLDERQRAAHRLDADLDEDAGRLLDVVARRLHEARRLPQLRQDAARALLGRRVREERLPGHARRDDVGVALRVALPGAHLVDLEHPRFEVRREHAVLEAFDLGQPVHLDVAQTTEVAGKRAALGFDRVMAEILEQIVVGVDAVERRQRRVRFVEVSEQILDEVRTAVRTRS